MKNSGNSLPLLNHENGGHGRNLTGISKFQCMDDISCIGFKVGHQVESLSLPQLPLNTLLTLSVSIESLSSSARVTSVKFQQGNTQTIGTHRSNPRYTWV